MEHPDATPIRVMLAEDDPLAQHAVAAYLGRAPDLELVGTAADGPAALDLAGSCSPDVAVVDVNLPLLDGIQVTAALTSRPRPVRVVCFTALGDDRVLYRALQAGASGFLLKSDAPGLILHGIRSAFSGDSLVSPKLVASLLAAHRARSAPPPGLTQGDKDLLRLIGAGRSNAEIADELCLATSTVKTYVSRLLGRLERPNRAALAALAHEWGLVEPASTKVVPLR